MLQQHWRKAGLATLATAGGLLAFSAWMAHRITQPRRRVAELAADSLLQPQDVSFCTIDGLTLHGWYLPHPQPRAALVLAHGYRMDRGEPLELAEALQALGYAVLLFDFRAHGLSEGLRSTIGSHEAEDVIAAARFLHAQPDLAGCPVGALGLSMGAVAVIGAAAREPLIRAVVADSAYATLEVIAAGGLRRLFHLPPFPFAPLIIRCGELLIGDKISTARPDRLIHQIAPRPVLLIHGTADTLIPMVNLHRLYAAAREPKEQWVVPGAEHVRAFHEARTAYLQRVDDFFTTAFAPIATAAASAGALVGVPH